MFFSVSYDTSALFFSLSFFFFGPFLKDWFTLCIFLNETIKYHYD